jgi:hypothetical protein
MPVQNSVRDASKTTSASVPQLPMAKGLTTDSTRPAIAGKASSRATSLIVCTSTGTAKTATISHHGQPLRLMLLAPMPGCQGARMKTV